jgi:hypothetical protein
MATETYKPIEIAKPGEAIATSGTRFEFTPEILADLAESYDPALFAAPIVVGHPKLNAPAFGTIGQVVYHPDRQRAEAHPSEVFPDFAEAVRNKLYRSVSLSMYLPDSPGNPKPGHHYLRHVGFLGAHPPAIKGLAAVQFGEAEAGVLEFGDWQTFNILRGVLGFLGRVRDWVLDERGQETADKLIPRDDLDWLNRGLAEAEAREMYEDKPEGTSSMNYAENTVGTTTDQTADFAEREAALTAQAADLAAREQRLRDQEQAAEHRRCLDFAESIKAKILPRNVQGLAAYLATTPSHTVLEFGEGEAAVKTNGREWLMGMLKELPDQVDFGEFDRGGSEEPAAGNPDALIAQRARAYHAQMQDKGVNLSFAEAVDAVSKNLDRPA